MRLAIPMVLALVSCTETDPLTDRWELVWADEFGGAADSAPSDDWVAEEGRGPNGDGWGNGELQYYTTRPENVSLNGGGQLRIRAIKEAYEGAEWTSARVKTKGKFEFAFGAVEASIRLPEGQGLWPAFWMLGANIDDVGWPTCGEIDIVEMFSDPYQVAGTIHGPGYSGGNAVGDDLVWDEKFTDDYHVFRIEWDPQHIAWFVDGELIHATHPGETPGFTPWVFKDDMFMLLNLAVGGTFVPNPDGTTPVTNEMLVDYVRVYERTSPLQDPLAVE